MASGVAAASAIRASNYADTHRDSLAQFRHRENPKLKEMLWGYFFIAPFLLVAVIFLVIPIFYSFYISLRETTLYTSWFNQFGDMKFVGLRNYTALLGSKLFWWSLVATAIYAILVIPGSIIAGLALALAVNPKMAGYRAMRAGFFLPHVFDVFVVGLIWLLLYNPKGGPFGEAYTWYATARNHVMGIFRAAPIDVHSSFIDNPVTVLPAIALVMILKGMGFGMVLFVTALNNIPESIFEAADIDGCTAKQKLRHVTLPMLRPMILFMAVTGLVGVLNAFTEFYALTKGAGGPASTFFGETVQSARVAGFHLYRFFDVNQYGTAAAMSFILLGIALVITYVNFRVLGERE